MAARAQLKHLRALLERRTPSGRPCVLVLGSGVNVQAAAEAGAGDGDDWNGLLWKVARQVGLTRAAFGRLPTTPLARWEALLRGWARQRDVEPFQAEDELQCFVCDELRQQERRGSHYALYGELLSAGWRDLVSLNFDRRTALHSGRERFVVPRRAAGWPAAAQTFERHSVVPHGAGDVETRIWYPHGDTRSAATLKLGVRNYGVYAGLMEQRRASLMRAFRLNRDSHERRGAQGRYTLGRMLEFGRRLGAAGSWFELLMAAPVVFVGCSLAPDEWPLWWLLHQRARNAVRDEPARGLETHVLVARRPGSELPAHLQGSPCGLQVTDFPSHDRLWSFLRAALRN